MTGKYSDGSFKETESGSDAAGLFLDMVLRRDPPNHVTD
ncbi:hypothetical protein PA08_0078 [Cutibacterium modestum P08]|nr:hypothetical protein PA08_0078 [Cutibacterium modestum P08]